MNDTPALSIVVPCFNEEAGLPELHRRVRAAALAASGGDYELLLVDDGSRDRTWEVITSLAATDPRVVGVKLSRNHGHQLALTAGLAVVRGATVLVIDADLQDPPELLGAMWEEMRRSEADVVYGRRRSRAGESSFKRHSASIFYRVLRRFTDVDIPADAGDFRLMSRRVSDLIVQMPERDRFIRGMVAWVGFRQVAFDYDRDPRYAGETKYPLRKMLAFALDAFLGFSMVPLRLAGYLALLLFVGLGAAAAYTLYSWMFLDAVPGWASTNLLIILVSAVQLWTLSVLGEYVGRTYLEVKGRPLYVIERVERGASAGRPRELQ